LFYFSFIAQQPLVGMGVIIVEASRSYSDKPHPVGLLWTNYQSDADTSTLQHRTLTTDTQPCPRRDSNPQFEPALPTNERPQTHALERATTWIGRASIYWPYLCTFLRSQDGHYTDIALRNVTLCSKLPVFWRNLTLPSSGYKCFTLNTEIAGLLGTLETKYYNK